MDQLFILANLCFAQKPEKAGAIFIHAREGEEILLKAVELYKSGYAPLVIINGLDKFKDYAGKEEWGSILEREGIRADSLETIKPATNTKIEAEAVAWLARERHWSKLIIVAHPYHLVRSWLTFINQMERQNYWFKAIMQSPLGYDWHRVVLGSQAEIEAPRWQIAEEEAKRIARYQGSRELATFEEALNYYRNFNSI